VCLSGCPELGRWDTPDLSLIHRSASDHRIITEHAFYENPNHAADTVKTASMLVAIVVGDALMVRAQAVLAIYFMDLFFEIYRLWIVWGPDGSDFPQLQFDWTSWLVFAALFEASVDSLAKSRLSVFYTYSSPSRSPSRNLISERPRVKTVGRNRFRTFPPVGSFRCGQTLTDDAPLEATSDALVRVLESSFASSRNHPPWVLLRFGY
jgi:hypothetical protein